MSTFKFQSYEGSAEADATRDVLWGKILFIDDLVTYEALTMGELRKAFEGAVRDYVATCEEIGKEPQRPCKGVFQVRISPELHKLALRRAGKDHTKLNDVVVKAMSAYLAPMSEANA